MIYSLEAPETDKLCPMAREICSLSDSSAVSSVSATWFTLARRGEWDIHGFSLAVLISEWDAVFGLNGEESECFDTCSLIVRASVPILAFEALSVGSS